MVARSLKEKPAAHFIAQVNLALEHLLDGKKKMRKCVLLHYIALRSCPNGAFCADLLIVHRKYQDRQSRKVGPDEFD